MKHGYDYRMLGVNTVSVISFIRFGRQIPP